MNKGVQILLERMDSNPDEFGFDDPMLSRKWRDITEQISQRYQSIIKNPDAKNHWHYHLDFLEDEEIVTLHNKLKTIRADEFTRDVMARLLADADDGNYHTSALNLGGAPKTIVASQHQIDAMQQYLGAQKNQQQAEMKLTQDSLANTIQAIQNINAKRAFGKGK
jgi:hypothetical protein